MKTLTFILSFSFFTFPAFAGSHNFEEYTELVDSLKSVHSNVKTVGVIPTPCLSCQALIEPNKKVDLVGEKVDLGQIDIIKRNTPFLFQLKRTKDTPEKIVLKYMNRYEVCDKLFIDTISNLASGPLTLGCAITKIVYSPHEIILDLSKYPKPAGNEAQILELKFTKEDYTQSDYDIDLTAVKGPPSKLLRKKERFFGNGFKVDLGALESSDEVKP